MGVAQGKCVDPQPAARRAAAVHGKRLVAQSEAVLRGSKREIESADLHSPKTTGEQFKW